MLKRKHAAQHVKSDPRKRRRLSRTSVIPYHRLPRAEKPVGKPWPKQKLLLYDAPCKMTDPLLRDVIKARRWKYSCKPCHATSCKLTGRSTLWIKEFEASVRGKHPKKLFGERGAKQDGYKLKYVPLPSHALWYLGWLPYTTPFGKRQPRQCYRDDFPQIVAKFGQNLPGEPGDYRIAKFPGTQRVCCKVNVTEAFNGKSWYPETYVLPQEKTAFLKRLRTCPQAYWIGKPGDACSGAGITVCHAQDAHAKEIAASSDGGKPRSVVQRYLAQPYLVGGYKSHMRVHLMVTNLDPLEAFVQENGQLLFATKPYSLSSKTLGSQFDPPVHVTNMGLNATEANAENFMKHKPVVGRGQQLRMGEFVNHLEKTEPAFNKAKLWQQILEIAEEFTRYLATAPNVVRRHGKLEKDRHFEIFGMDLMLDTQFKVWLCEVNTDPGLGYPDKLVLGKKNPDYKKELQACTETLHDMFNLLGLDAGTAPRTGSLKRWFKLDFSESK